MTCGKLMLYLFLCEVILVAIVYYSRTLTLRTSSARGQQHPVTSGLPRPNVDQPPITNRNVNGAELAETNHERHSHPRPTAGGMAFHPNETTCKTSVAIGLAITTRNAANGSYTELTEMPFFRSLLSSFCKTASERYDYRFYLSYDYNDEYLTERSFRVRMSAIFGDYASEMCPYSSAYSLRFVSCKYAGKPAWAQNDAMIEAYLSGIEYFYRINDDTVMTTGNWTERFIDALDRFTPPRIGAVGPKHQGGNLDILTYDFTHRIHVNIHGFYYPRKFPDWYADRWITSVYKPGRSVKLQDVQLVHTMDQGRRYNKTKKADSEVERQVEEDRISVIR